MGEKQVSFTERCPLLRGEKTALTWDRKFKLKVSFTERCPKYYTTVIETSVLYREVSEVKSYYTTVLARETL
jgi:hypothetical protein